MIDTKYKNNVLAKNVFLNFALFIIVAGFYLVIFIQQISFLLNSKLLHEEQRQLFPYHQLNNPELFKADYITSFLTSSNRPYLYDQLTRLWLTFGGDLFVFHHVLPIILWLLFLSSIAIAGWKLQGVVSSVGACALVLAQPMFLYQITSAVPHAFAFPLLSWTIVALLFGSLPGLIILTLLASVLYIPVTPIIGLSLIGFLIQSRKNKLKLCNRATIFRLFIIVGITGSLSILLGASSLQPKQGFGDTLAPFQEIETYPENGPNGRFFLGVEEPLIYFAGKFVNQFHEWISIDLGLWLLFICLFMAIKGFFSLKPNSESRKRLSIYILVTVSVALLFLTFKPYQAYRFVMYPLMIVLSILIPVWLVKIFTNLQNKTWSFFLPIIFISLFTLIFETNSQAKIGYYPVIDEESRNALNFVKTLPAESLIAGWPDIRAKGNVTEFIPYIAKRRVLILGKTHYPSYKGYLMEMRKRMYALTDAYFATDERAIKNLKQTFNVDYLLVDKRHFSGDYTEPKYFAPFNQYLRKAWKKGKIDGFLLADATSSAGKIYESRHYYLLDINKF